MALGKRRRERQLEAFVAASDLPKSPGHPFYAALNGPGLPPPRRCGGPLSGRALRERWFHGQT